MLQPRDRNCLVARSRCFVKMGRAENALKDAEDSLKDDKSFFKVGFSSYIYILQNKNMAKVLISKYFPFSMKIIKWNQHANRGNGASAYGDCPVICFLNTNILV